MTPTPEPILRPLRESDLAAITEIYNHEVLTGLATLEWFSRQEPDIRAWLSSERHPAWVAVEGETVIGFSALYAWSPRKGYDLTAENTVYLRHDRRGLGLGKALLKRVLEDGRKRGFHAVIARITAGNAASLKLHAELGFTRVGTLKEVGKKFDRVVDVELWQIIL
jgi:phosphinothricin acetyltransferase